MNLICGKMMDSEQAKQQLALIDEIVLHALASGKLARDHVITACDTLSKKLNEQEHLPLLVALGMENRKAKDELGTVRRMLSRESLEERINREFGDWTERSFQPLGDKRTVRQAWEPLGALLHIAAGNADALPVFSVIEGLLTENVNILKLPGDGDELSIRILMELIAIEPRIAEKVIVFDLPSSDISAMKQLADVADAIVVWGGDAAVHAVRQMAKPNTRIIEWGHKISFAYVSGDEVSDADLQELAQHICETNQLFCSSCQGIYVDTNSFDQVATFANRFLGILEQAAGRDPLPDDPFRNAQTTLAVYTEELESIHAEKRVFRGEHCSVVAYNDNELVPSYMFRNAWVKPLSRENILKVLKPYKNYLQSVALICEQERRQTLEETLVTAGIVRVTCGENLSAHYCGMPHDGEFELRRYIKIVSFER